MASDPRPLQRLSRITAEVDRVASRETARRLEELERRLSALERPGLRAAGAEVDAIRVRSLEGRAADVDVALKGVREELRELKLRVEAVSTEAAARSNTVQIALQEVRRLLEERTGPLKMLEAEMKQQAARAEEARNEAQRWIEGAEPLLLRAAEATEALGPDGAAQVRRLPEALQGLEKLAAGLERAEQGMGQVAAQVEGLVKAGEEAAAVLEELKGAVEPWKGGPLPAQMEPRLAALEKEAGRWEDLGEVLLGLRQGLGALQKEAARMEAMEKRVGVVDAHDHEISRLSAVAEDLLGTLEEVRKSARPPELDGIPALQGRVARLEKESERLAELGEVLLRLREGVEGLRKEAAKLDGLEKRTEALELQGKDLGRLNEAVEALLRGVEELRKGPPEASRIPELASRLEEHERTLQRFAGIAEEVLRGAEAMGEQQKGLEGALRALRESPVETRLQEVELNQAKVTGAVEHLLKQVDDLEANLERLRRVVLQQAGQRAEG